MPFRRALGLALALWAVAASPAPALTAAELRPVLSRHALKLGPYAGAYVVDLDSGRVLYARKENIPRVPASNEKLFVTASGLMRFGAAGVFTTSVRVPAGATIDPEGVLRGDLYLVGGGDPTLRDDDLRALVAALRAAGLRRLTGGVRGDESLFDLRRGSYDSGWLPDWDLGGWLSALAWNHGRARPGGPAVAAAMRFQRLLRAAGVTAGRRARAGTLPDEGVELAVIPSPPMSAIAAGTNIQSENFYAEMLVKGLGARFGSAGSTAAGIEVVRDDLLRLGIHPRMVDGSGLSRANRATPRQLVRLLERMRNSEAGPAFDASLPVAGRNGTLRDRMRRTPAARRCRAKTGTLIGVSSLSGYCTTAEGTTVAFSIVANGVCNWCAKKIEDRMVAALARYEP